MRNLELLRPLVLQQVEALAAVRCTCVNVDAGHVYCVSNDKVSALTPESGEIAFEVPFSSVTPLSVDDLSNDVVACHYLSDMHQLVVAFSAGDVVALETAMFSMGTAAVGEADLECVGTIDAGVLAMCWSPDEEIGAFLTGDGKLVLMTKDFDILAETIVEVTEFGVSAFVTVGWGSKETQFHGSEGKEAAKAAKKPTLPARPWDDRRARVSWRGDGQCLAVSSISAENGGRRIRVFSREGQLQSTSEDVDGLEQAVVWKPSGSLIASSQRLPHRHNIVFFEKNGLRHGEFTLPFQRLDVRVCELTWSIDSTVLAIWCESLPSGVDEKSEQLVPSSSRQSPPAMSYVLLWTFSNYHYYLKQQLQWANESLLSVSWDPESPLRLHVLTASGQYGHYDWFLNTCVSPGLCAENTVTVNVTDGCKLMQTPLRHAVVPPPLAHRTLALPCPASQSAALSANAAARTPARFGVLLSDGRLGVYEERPLPAPERRGKDKCGFRVDDVPPACLGTVSIPHVAGTGQWGGHCVRHLVWLDYSTLLCVAWDVNIAEDYLLVLDVQHSDEGLAVKLRSSAALEKSAHRVVANPDRRVVAVELNDGSLWRAVLPETPAGGGESGGDEPVTLEPWRLDAPAAGGPGLHLEGGFTGGLRLPVPCSNIMTCAMGDQDVILSLTDHYRLYVNDIEIAANCTSFAVHDEFLVLTTHSHTCRCLSLSTPLSELSLLKDSDRAHLDESIRRVERGSRIVATVPYDTKLVLQMPRGNLETIHPRALVLSAVRRHLTNLEFVRSLDIMRRHRINMNLIHDHQPAVFLDNARLFVEQVDDVARINLFISDLSDEDVTVKMYHPSCSSKSPPAATSITGQSSAASMSGKTARVCDELRGAMVAVDEKRFLHSILLTHIKKPVPELEEVLARIKRLRDSSSLSPSAVSDAIKFVLYSVEVGRLFEVALGMYDIDLVLMVAEKSQMDPKEYVPFLNSLRYMTPFDKYTIDLQLRRFSKALNHLSQCSDKFELAFDLVKSHKLYQQALQLYTGTAPAFAKRVAEVYGECLVEEKRFSEAAIILCKFELYAQAMPVLVQAVNWRQAVVIARKLKYDQEATAQLAHSLADALKSQRRHREAVQVLLDYSASHDEAIAIALEGQLWEEAMRLMHRFDKEALVEEELRPCLLQACRVQVTSLGTHHTTFVERTARLCVVRDQKLKARQERLDMGLPVDRPESDLYSDASSLASRSTTSSGGSGHSRQSSRTAKNRRKAERKKHRLREGSVHEEEALIESLAEIITLVDNCRDDICAVLRVLCGLGETDQARELQALFTQLLKAISQKMPVIWKPSSGDAQVQVSLGADATAADFVNRHRQQQNSANQLPVVGVLAPAFSADLSSWRLTILD